ncbi:hypothetical protein [Desulfonema magnum]|uniref:Nucleotide cyclase n=1 Tax=Desulfonema magnum TaxID=45655 RepID=A0A975GRS8_9BACT|nr:hypothetical protein [Desulfonema magnum]QTA91391.1 nucleotide cyclase [Desulfonema magnum]
MFTFLKNSFKPLSLKEFPIKTPEIIFSLNRLARGVDNIRYDVHLSPDFCKAAIKIITQIIAAHTKSEEILGLDKSANPGKEKDEFKRLCHEVMMDGVNKAKLRRDIQIDYLVQAAIIKFLTKSIRDRYEKLIVHFKNIIQQYESSPHKQEEAGQLKRELSEILEKKKKILRNTGNELFQHLTEVQTKELKEMRESNFGAEAVLPDHIFSNPLFHVEDIADDFFTIEEYDILLGHRLEDTDNYNTLITFIKSLLAEIASKDAAAALRKASAQNPDSAPKTPSPEPDNQNSDAWTMEVSNIDMLFNYFQSWERLQTLKKQKWTKNSLLYLKNYAREQKKLLNFFYRKFRKKGIIERITATYEMQPVYLEYCPPLVPQLVSEFLISPKSRRGIKTRLKRLKPYYEKSFSLRPLRDLVIKLEKVRVRTRKAYLIRFLNGFIRYHRDVQNYNMLKEAMDCINLTTKEDIISLSRANNTLYEFLLPHERESEEKPVISHVIIKADVRGSTDVVHKMKKKGLNPATYFSLNFFDPITEILPDYGAVKVCIEGDAYILSIYEREDTPEDWYSVARACGLAISMLSVIQRYNTKNKKYQLPELELGIGITYRDNAPTIFFDGDNQIMISSAINLADRLSGCSKAVRKKMAGNNEPFNLYVFQTASDEEIAVTSDDLSLRYNVNGIELDATGFKKLSEEIDLKPVEASVQKKKHKFYIGKFPTVTGTYQRLVIRESLIPRIDADTLEITDITDRKYYELCTNTKLCEYIKQGKSI